MPIDDHPTPTSRPALGLFPWPTRRRLVGALLAPLLLLVACSGDDDSGDDGATGSTTTTGLPNPDTTIPDTPVGQQLTWLLEISQDGGPLSQSDYEQHFTADFRAQVSLEELTASFTQGEIELVEVLPGRTPHYLTAKVEHAGTEGFQQLRVDPVDPAHPISMALVAPLSGPPPDVSPSSWSAVDADVAELAPRAGLSVARVGDDGSCEPIHELAADQPQPLASTIKLWVLGALAEQVEAGEISWDDEVGVDDALKTVPSGILQDEPAGTSVPVFDLAALMISISDNTATDHLIDLVGREEVEAQLEAFGMADPSLNQPLHTIGEMLALEWADYPTLADEWRTADAEGRRALLDDPRVRNATPTFGDLLGVQEPRWVGVESMGTPDDLCQAMAGLRAQSQETGLAQVEEIMTINDEGLGLDPETWTSTWYKGGSQPGVLTLAYMAEHRDGETYAVNLALADENAAFDEVQLTADAQALIRSAFTLAAG